MSIFGYIFKALLPWKRVKDCCTLWFDGVWQDCCCQHDDDYTYGEIPKYQSDKDLRDCVRASKHPIIANVMFIGVSIFGWVPWALDRIRDKKRGE